MRRAKNKYNYVSGQWAVRAAKATNNTDTPPTRHAHIHLPPPSCPPAACLEYVIHLKVERELLSTEINLSYS